MSERDKAFQALKASFEQDAIEQAQRRERPGPRFTPDGRAVGWLIALVLLSAFGLLAVLVGMHTLNQFRANDAIGQFCRAEEDGNYTAAYRLISQRTRVLVTSTNLADTTKNANILTCYSAQRSWWIDVNGDHTTVPVWFVSAANSTQRDLGRVTLVRERGDWHIDTITSASLNLP